MYTPEEEQQVREYFKRDCPPEHHDFFLKGGFSAEQLQQIRLALTHDSWAYKKNLTVEDVMFFADPRISGRLMQEIRMKLDSYYREVTGTGKLTMKFMCPVDCFGKDKVKHFINCAGKEEYENGKLYAQYKSLNEVVMLDECGVLWYPFAYAFVTPSGDSPKNFSDKNSLLRPVALSQDKNIPIVAERELFKLLKDRAFRPKVVKESKGHLNKKKKEYKR